VKAPNNLWEGVKALYRAEALFTPVRRGKKKSGQGLADDSDCCKSGPSSGKGKIGVGRSVYNSVIEQLFKTLREKGGDNLRVWGTKAEVTPGGTSDASSIYCTMGKIRQRRLNSRCRKNEVKRPEETKADRLTQSR